MTQRARRIAIGAHLLHGQGGYRSAGIHTYIEQTLRYLPQADPALAVTLFTRHAPDQLPSTIDVRSTRWPTERPIMRILWEQLALPRVHPSSPRRRAARHGLRRAAWCARVRPW